MKVLGENDKWREKIIAALGSKYLGWNLMHAIFDCIQNLRKQLETR